MMWNTSYGMMRVPEPTGTAAIGPDQAVRIADGWLSEHRTGLPAAEPDQFPGYYTLHTLRDTHIVGMLSVNATTGEVWYHTWHGRFIQMQEPRSSARPWASQHCARLGVDQCRPPPRPNDLLWPFSFHFHCVPTTAGLTESTVLSPSGPLLKWPTRGSPPAGLASNGGTGARCARFGPRLAGGEIAGTLSPRCDSGSGTLRLGGSWW